MEKELLIVDRTPAEGEAVALNFDLQLSDFAFGSFFFKHIVVVYIPILKTFHQMPEGSFAHMSQHASALAEYASCV